MIRNRQRMLTAKEKGIAKEALFDAIKMAGGTQAALAKALKCSRANVNQIVKSGCISLLMAKRLEEKFGIPRQRTLPNVFS